LVVLAVARDAETQNRKVKNVEHSMEKTEKGMHVRHATGIPQCEFARSRIQGHGESALAEVAGDGGDWGDRAGVGGRTQAGLPILLAYSPIEFEVGLLELHRVGRLAKAQKCKVVTKGESWLSLLTSIRRLSNYQS
jgi:hypothetical protein